MATTHHNNPPPRLKMKFDCDISFHDVQQLSNADAVAAFFSRLGYNTNARIEQSPGNLGISADGIVRPIKRIELIADQDTLLQVYLMELKSVTVTHTRSLARHFRNRTGNYLLVLTSDYDRLDFVLLEKYLPPATASKKTIGSPQVGVRPRTLTVERQKPSRVQLRVLRRFTYSENDPIAQYDKLLSAYAISDWSEEHFNNRALFSDYYLKERLRDFPEWSEDPKPAFLELNKLYLDKSSQLRGQKEEMLRRDLLEPIFKTLGFTHKEGKNPGVGSDVAEPDYHLFLNDEKKQPIAICLAYPWGRSLDGKDHERDMESPEENPGGIVVTLLAKGEAPWAIVTNGKLWRLYSQKAHSRATNYYEFDLEEALAQIGQKGGDPSESFRYFWLLFRRQAFEPSTQFIEGEQLTISFLDRLLTESKEYAKELGERLKGQIFEKIFPHLAEGFITHIRERDGLHSDLSQEKLDSIFQGVLTLLYRLLFLLYAEARDLLPVKEVRGYFEASIAKIKGEVAEVAGQLVDEADKKLGKHYRKNQYALYDRLTKLFQVIDQGDSALNVPVYNGGLFLSNPPEDDNSPEAANARFLDATKVPDLYLSKAINLLTRDKDPKRQDLVSIDFKSLGVRQLGSIYEGLLEFKIRIAPEKMAVVKGKKTEEIIPYREVIPQKRKILTAGRGKNAMERIFPKGAVYLENDKHERKATGSYYTPDHIVEYIVENTVGPVLKEKFEEQMRPKLRQAQQAHREAIKRKEAFEKQKMKGDDPGKVAFTYRHVVDELFNIKVLDPAMGSGHFLVEAVDFITDKAIDFLNAFPWNPVYSHLEETRQTILKEMDEQGITIDPKRLTDVNLLKRHVLKRCIYGVDLNPMAVELAKVSLWLDCFTLGAPLSFLDHHMKCGNSLIGSKVDEVREKIDKGQTLLFGGSQFTGLMLATDLMRHVGELSDATSAQVKQSREEFRKASDALAPFKRALDIYTSQWFGNPPVKTGKGKKAQWHYITEDFLKSEESQEWIKEPVYKENFADTYKQCAQNVLKDAEGYQFFHWELEFPEVFYGPKSGTTQVVQRMENGGFDAVIGNPPYDELSEYYSKTSDEEKTFFSISSSYSQFLKGRVNLYRLFILRGLEQTKNLGILSYIVPMTLLADSFSLPIREYLIKRKKIIFLEVFPQKDNPLKRVFREAKLSTCIFGVKNHLCSDEFKVRTHPAQFILRNSPNYLTEPEELGRVFNKHIVIPIISQSEWNILKKAFGRDELKRLGEISKIYVGEVFDNAPNKKYLSDNPEGPLVIRGANLDRYILRDKASQGKNRYLLEQKFRRDKKKAKKINYINFERIGLQRGSAVDNWRRLIGCIVPPGLYCFDTVLLIIPKGMDIKILLSFMNCDLWEWRFRCTSTTNHVNEYELVENVIPTCFLDENSIEYTKLKGFIDSLSTSSEKKLRCSKNQIIPENSIDYKIDDLIFSAYNLDEGEIKTIRDALNIKM